MTLGVKNYMEDVVVPYVDEILPQSDICQCPRCRLDVIALTLNSLKPKYIVPPMGYAYTHIDELQAQNRADTIVAVRNAIKTVKEKPRHDL